MAKALRMPQLGESVVEGTVAKWLKSRGDAVTEYEPLLEVVTDKVDSEITSPASGYVLELYADEGETVEVGTLLAYIGQQDESVPRPGSPEALVIVAPHRIELEAEAGPAPPALVSEPTRIERPGLPVSPVVARIASEHNVDLSKVTGTGRGGRVTKKDLLRYIEEGGAVPAPRHEPVELLPLTPMRRAIAEHMVRSVRTSPHASTVFEVDASRIVAHRAAVRAEFAADGITLAFTPFFLAASARALAAVPLVNSTFTADGIQLKREINIGVAVAVDDGLIVPVIKHAARKSLRELAVEVHDLARRARARQLQPDEVQGGTFTITNHGVSGSLVGLPIINQPQAAILGVGMIQKRVVVVDQDAIAVRPMVYLSLTFDHRIIDGAVADRFMTVIKTALDEWSA